MDECERSYCPNIRTIVTPRTHFLQAVRKGRAVVYGQILQFLHRWMKLVYNGRNSMGLGRARPVSAEGNLQSIPLDRFLHLFVGPFKRFGYVLAGSLAPQFHPLFELLYSPGSLAE